MADIIGTAKALLAGASTNQELCQTSGNPPHWCGGLPWQKRTASLGSPFFCEYSLDQTTLSSLLDRFVELEAQQERQKADLHQTSEDQRELRKSLLAEFGRWISVLEGQLGKNAEKLQEFGIAPRNLRPHKGPRTTADAQEA